MKPKASSKKDLKDFDFIDTAPKINYFTSTDSRYHPNTQPKARQMDADMTAEAPDANREHKNSVFTMLFDDKAVLIELSNALFGAHYGADTPIEVTTLKNVLSYGRVNDLSYILDNRLIVLVEHQSTLSDVIPYRMLLYIAETYSQLYHNRMQYRRYKFPLKRPKFIVLYNGDEDMKEDVLTLRLSDMFAKFAPEDGAADDGLIDLELTVTVYNIKNGRNANIVKYCKTLREYGIFTDMIRENRKTMSLEEAIRKAVEDSIDRNVLKTFLLKHKQEIETMLLTDWDWNVALDVSKEEGFEMGEKKGFEKGLEEARREDARAMREEGIDVNTISRITGFSVDTIINL